MHFTDIFALINQKYLVNYPYERLMIELKKQLLSENIVINAKTFPMTAGTGSTPKTKYYYGLYVERGK